MCGNAERVERGQVNMQGILITKIIIKSNFHLTEKKMEPDKYVFYPKEADGENKIRERRNK